jgi:hypothetical protein
MEKLILAVTDLLHKEKMKVGRQEAAAANAVMIAALKRPSREELNRAFGRALKIFNSALQAVKNNNPGKFILASIAVTSKNVHPVTGIRIGYSIESELNRAGLRGGNQTNNCANLVKLVEEGGGTYFRNPTPLKKKNIAPPGTLLYDAGNCNYTCKLIEMFLQMLILICGTTKEKIGLLQFTPGNGGLKGGAPFKVGFRLIICDEDGNPPFGLVSRKNIDLRLMKHISLAPTPPRTTMTTPAMTTTLTMTSTFISTSMSTTMRWSTAPAALTTTTKTGGMTRGMTRAMTWGQGKAVGHVSRLISSRATGRLL